MFFKSSETRAKVHDPHGGGAKTGDQNIHLHLLKSVQNLHCWWSQIHSIFISYSVVKSSVIENVPRDHIIEYGPIAGIIWTHHKNGPRSIIYRGIFSMGHNIFTP